MPSGGFNLISVSLHLKTNYGFKSIEESDDVCIKTVAFTR